MYCVVLFGGIPGCGKTELLNYIVTNKRDLFNSYYLQSQSGGCSNFTSAPQIRMISFDKLCTVEDQAKIVKTMNGWKNFRVHLLEAAERYICEVCRIQCNLQGPLSRRSQELLEKLRILNCSLHTEGEMDTNDILFFVEDNFYYHSMRYEWFQVARRDGLGFCQMYLTCPIDVALKRNLSRNIKIPEDKIELMYSVMEYPNPKKNKWERFSLLHDTTKELEYSAIYPIIELITCALKEPAQMLIERDKIEARAICSKNVIHQVDKILRKITAEIIQQFKGEKNSHVCNDKIQQIVIARQKLFLDIKQGTVCLERDVTEDIEKYGANGTDAVVKLENYLRDLLIEWCSCASNGDMSWHCTLVKSL